MLLFTVEDPRRYRLEASVDEDGIGLVKIGQTIPVRIDALDSDTRRENRADCPCC